MNTDGINSTSDITLSGESSAYFDSLYCNTFQDVSGSYFTGITSNIQTQIDSITTGLPSTYVTLGTAQNITGAKSFNTVLPTSTVTPSNAGDLTTKTYNDSTYARLAVANTFTEQNTFQKGILPCSSTRTSDIQISQNSFQYRQPTSANNIGIGNLTLQGNVTTPFQQYNTGKRNIAIGEESLKRGGALNDCIFIGYQAGVNCGNAESFSVGVDPNRCIAIGTYSQTNNLYATDQISIGYNSLINASSGTGNVVIANNGGNGINYQNQNTIIGANCCPSVNDNGVTAVSYNCLGAATGSFNGGTAVGSYAGYN